MSVNRYQPHILVLPEDDANRQLANGFLLGLDTAVLARRIQVLAEAGGWLEVVGCFQSEHVSGMYLFPQRSMVLLIDLDGDVKRLADVKKQIPEQLNNRVFILGAFSEPEGLKQAGLGSYESIGSTMARDCLKPTGIWEHQLLKHNAAELVRLREHVRPILFET